MIRKIINLLKYQKWTDCKHDKLIPSGLMGWKCKDCNSPVRD